MSYINLIHEDDAEGQLKASSLFPDSLEAHLGLYKTLMFKKSPLSRAQREMIATTVSAVNDCHY